MHLLKDILAGFPKEILQSLSPLERSREIGSVTSDSRQVGTSTLFVAVHGGTQDGHEFIPQALAKGAAAVLGEREKPANWPVDSKVPYIKVKDSKFALACAAAAFYGHPTHSMLLVGVTGTSGKTTTTYLLESILKAAGHRVGVIGTVNFRYGSKVLDSTHTTPGAVELQRLLAEMKDAGCSAVVMEVSSHSLKQQRTACIAFDGMVFTNLSPEHLDFHPDMDDYFRSKALLFTDMVDYSLSVGKHPFGAIQCEDTYGARLMAELKGKAIGGFRFAGFGFKSAELQVSLNGIYGRAGNVEIKSCLAGQFNADNILAAVELARGLGIADSVIAEGIVRLTLVPGRLERVPHPRGIHIFVDYAHKPDALEKVLRTLREVREGRRLITVFGCGGDRDRTKRPVMGKSAVELSDYVFVTSDNPRTENPSGIIAEILKGIPEGKSNFRVEADRKRAIEEAIQSAQAGDLVLIAGKGHEDYQIIADPAQPGGTRKIHFDDREIALQAE